MKYICPEAKGCTHDCSHKKPHEYNDARGCGNVRCHKKDPRPITKEEWGAIGKGEVPQNVQDHRCVEVK